MSNAKYGGYEVHYIDSKKAVWFKVEEGVRGINIPATVFYDAESDKYTITSSGRQLKILSYRQNSSGS